MARVTPVKAKASRARRSVALAGALVVAAGCGSGDAQHAKAPRASTTLPASSTAPAGSQAPLQAPTASPQQDGDLLSEVVEADPTLATYSQQYGDMAARALLTDGSAFCAFLLRGGGVDQALVSLAIGARSVENQTHLPLSVTTFNAIEAVALLTLCPAEQSQLPAADRSRITQLGQELGRS
jgi:hypothetical protein